MFLREFKKGRFGEGEGGLGRGIILPNVFWCVFSFFPLAALCK